MSSRSRNIIDLKKAAASRAKARERMTPLKLQKPLRLKTRRRKRRVIAFCVCLLAGVGAIGALGAATHVQQLAIADVAVAGTRQLAEDALVSTVKKRLDESTFRLFSRNNIFLYPQSAIESDLTNSFPRIKHVSVARESLLASALVVRVEERTPYAVWCDDACFVLDEHGFIFAEQHEMAKKAYTFYGGLVPNAAPIGQTFLEGRLSSAVQLLDSLERAGYAPVRFTVESERDFTVSLAQGQRLLASFDVSPNDILRNLETALASDALKGTLDSLDYIDLRFGNKVYYK
jgi:cell division septal protein FtsQ